MAYADFTLHDLARRSGLTIEEDRDLFPDQPDALLRPEFLDRLNQTLPLALRVSTEKARSEFIIAPILGELWLLQEQTIGVLSGVDFPVDPSQGLAGVCDYIITRSPELLFVQAPVLMVVEAKNEEMKRGYAQCIAEMLAAQAFNHREGTELEAVYGAVTTGELWTFLELNGTTVSIDARTYHIERIAKIMGILLRLTSTP